MWFDSNVAYVDIDKDQKRGRQESKGLGEIDRSDTAQHHPSFERQGVFLFVALRHQMR